MQEINGCRRRRRRKEAGHLLLALGVFTALEGFGKVVPTSPAYQDVVAAVRWAEPGDTVEIGSGTAGWHRPLMIEKALTIRGAGIGATIIINEVEGTPERVKRSSQNPLMIVRCPREGRVRVTGMEFRGNQRGSGIYLAGKKWGEFRIDHMKFEKFADRAVFVDALLAGLVDNCDFMDCKKTVDIQALLHQNSSWRERLTLGTTRSVVVEDCVFLYEEWHPRSAGATTSHGLGGRGTWRFNAWTNRNSSLDFFPILDAHGNQRPVENNHGHHRGTRQFEIYGNTFVSDVGVGCRLTDIRGGTGVIFDNRYIGADFQRSFYMREEDAPYKKGFLRSYPGHDKHMVHIWGNTRNGEPLDSFHTAHEQDFRFIVEGRNLFWFAREGYEPLEYPHPFREGGGAVNRPEPPTNLRVVE